MDDPPTGAGESTPRADADDEGAVSLTTAFELLARSPRRRLLYRLYQHDDPIVSLDALVRRLAERDGDDSEHDEIRVALHHVHLPKLADAGVIAYDPDGEEVRYLGDPRLDDLIEWGLREDALD